MIRWWFMRWCFSRQILGYDEPPTVKPAWHVLVQDLVLTLEEFKHFYRDTERIMQERDLKLVCLGEKDNIL